MEINIAGHQLFNRQFFLGSMSQKNDFCWAMFLVLLA
jgi:hypothetical protein